MSTLIPSYSSCLSRMTSGEKRFAQRLEAKLEDDYLCWYRRAGGPGQQPSGFHRPAPEAWAAHPGSERLEAGHDPVDHANRRGILFTGA
jgi:hypothetical protein